MKDHEVVELLNVLGGIKTALETRQKGIEAWLETLCGEVHSLGGSVLRVSHAVAALTQELHDQNPGKK